MIGLIAISDLATLLSTTSGIVMIAPMAAIPCFISILLMVTTVCLFLRYFCVDNYDTRLRLVKASAFMIFANAITYFGLLVAIWFHKDLKQNLIWGLMP